MKYVKNEGTIMIIDYFLKKDQFHDAEKEIELLPNGKIKNNYLEVILKNDLEHGWLKDARKIAKEIKREVTADEWENLYSFYVKEERWDDVIMIAKLSKRKLTTDEIETFLMDYLKKGWLESAQEVAEELNRELTVDELKGLIEAYLKRGRSKEIEQLIELLPKEEDKDKHKYLMIIMKIYLAENSIDNARRAAKLFDKLFSNLE